VVRTIRERLREAIKQQSRTRPIQPRTIQDASALAEFAPVREAGVQLREELKDVRDLHVSIEIDGVRIALYDKDLWFSYDPKRRVFVGSESDTLWMDGGVREETYKWDTAEACTEAMIQASARYVALTRASATLRRPPD